MKKAAQISDNEKWQAVVNCEKSYDGIFINGVKTTGILTSIMQIKNTFTDKYSFPY